ncbi:hypothetical protein [Acidithiobacillus sp. AMEEHan]|uniref:hypothetical protein n=1 Tax=Acidithiobacillus sp. AMEEHan TaxID=2994951 RepID=UPI0027E56632|nr:hypothetical protein [Acidithiobacillus sp. AMEEHan]
MDPQRITQLVENTHEIQRQVRQSLHEIDRRALNAMVLVKRHGDALAGYGVIATAFREQAAKLQAKAEELQHFVAPLTEAAMRLLQIQQYDQMTQQMVTQMGQGKDLGSLPDTRREWGETIQQEQEKIQSILKKLLLQLERFQEGIAEQEYVVTNGRIEAALSEGSGAPLMRVSRDMGEAVSAVRQAIQQWKQQLEEFTHESGTGF